MSAMSAITPNVGKKCMVDLYSPDISHHVYHSGIYITPFTIVEENNNYFDCKTHVGHAMKIISFDKRFVHII